MSVYPVDPEARTRWIVAQRPERALLDPSRPYAFLVEDERAATGEIVPVATVFLTNRECPWRCVMCDLWKNTLATTLEPGEILKQIAFALERLPPAHTLKLYNSGSFFDPRAIPREDHAGIAALANRFAHTIVECHPSLVSNACGEFADRLQGSFEIAMGLETAHPATLEKLNKRMTVESFRAAADWLEKQGIALRVFILVQPPFLASQEALFWAERSIDLAFDCGATAVSLIATRGGNGAMESLEHEGLFARPSLEVVERAVAYGLATQRGRVFVDLWNLAESVVACAACCGERLQRLHRLNLEQLVSPLVACDVCGGMR